MATTSIWPIRGVVSTVINYARNPEKTREESAVGMHQIDNVIQYAANELKTETRAFVTCINCTDEESAAREFMETKRLWNKTGGRQCFHGYQSFQRGEVDAATAHKIGVELAQRCWGDRFEVVVATHCNTDCYHTHFVLNSVSFADGLHFDNRPEDYRYMREMSDWLCRKYRLSVITNPSGRGRHYTEYMAEKNNSPTFRSTIRADIDRTIKCSLTMREFFDGLRALGYDLDLYRKDGTPLKRPGLRLPDGKYYLSFRTLGKDYDLEEIKQRILKNKRREVPFSEMEQKQVKLERAQMQPPYRKHVTGLRGLYLRYCFELHIIQRHPASAQKLSGYMRYELARLDRLDAETQLLARNEIETIDQLEAHRKDLTDHIQNLEQERVVLQNDLRRYKRRGDSVRADAIVEQRKQLSAQIRSARKEVSLCDDIATRSARNREELEQVLDEQEAMQRREEQQHWRTQTTQRSRS